MELIKELSIQDVTAKLYKLDRTPTSICDEGAALVECPNGHKSSITCDLEILEWVVVLECYKNIISRDPFPCWLLVQEPQSFTSKCWNDAALAVDVSGWSDYCNPTSEKVYEGERGETLVLVRSAYTLVLAGNLNPPPLKNGRSYEADNLDAVFLDSRW